MKEKRRRVGTSVWVSVVVAALFWGVFCVGGEAQAAAPRTIKIAAVYSLSGPFSRNGTLAVQGMKAAMGWVNDNGGIKSLGGAKLVPVIGDAASNVGPPAAPWTVC